MLEAPPDLAQLRFDNAMALFDEFVRATVRHDDLSTLRGLEGRFAEQLLIQPSYWSQIKARSRQIGERLARQFEQRCKKPAGWLDEPHGDAAVARSPAETPRDEAERFVVDLVLTYYRRDPDRARARLLALLGEAMQASASPAAIAHTPTSASPLTSTPKPTVRSDDQLWSQARAAVAPLKRKR